MISVNITPACCWLFSRNSMTWSVLFLTCDVMEDLNKAVVWGSVVQGELGSALVVVLGKRVGSLAERGVRRDSVEAGGPAGRPHVQLLHGKSPHWHMVNRLRCLHTGSCLALRLAAGSWIWQAVHQVAKWLQRSPPHRKTRTQRYELLRLRYAGFLFCVHLFFSFSESLNPSTRGRGDRSLYLDNKAQGGEQSRANLANGASLESPINV